MRHGRGQQAVDVGGEPDVLDARHHGLLHQRVLCGAGLEREVAAGHVLQRGVTTELVKHLAHGGVLAIAWDAEHSQRTGGLGLHALDALLDQAVEGDLLAQLQLVHIGGQTAVHHLEQLVEFVGTGLQHLERLVGLDSVGHHLAVIAHQARQEVLADARLSGLGLDLVKGHRLGLDVQRIGHTAHDGGSVLGLVARQVERLVGHTTGFTLSHAKGLAAFHRSTDLVCKGLVSFGDDLEAALGDGGRQFALHGLGGIGHQSLIGLGRASGD